MSPSCCANIIQDTQGLAAFSPGEIAAFASIFANIKRTDEAIVTPNSGRLHLDQAAQKYSELVLSYENQEAQARVWTGNYEQPTFDLMEVKSNGVKVVRQKKNAKLLSNA